MPQEHIPVTEAERNYNKVADEWFRDPTPKNELRRRIALGLLLAERRQPDPPRAPAPDTEQRSC